MNPLLRAIYFAAALLFAAALSGCGRDGAAAPDPTALEAAFQQPAEPAPEEAPAEAPAEAPPPPVNEGPPVQQLVGQAAAAMRQDEFSEAMVLLQTLRSNPRISPEQLTVVQDTMAAMQQDLARRAEAGDARARQALELISQRTRW